MAIEYITISYEDYYKLSDEERKAKSYYFEFPHGEKRWIVNGKLHREDEPAIVYHDGTKFWYINGENHREDGPAIIYPDGSISWYLNGIRYTFENWCEKLNKSDEEKVFLRLKYGN